MAEGNKVDHYFMNNIVFIEFYSGAMINFLPVDILGLSHKVS